MSFPITISKCTVTINNVTNNYYNRQKRVGPGRYQTNPKKIQPVNNAKSRQQQQASPSQLTSKFNEVLDVSK